MDVLFSFYFMFMDGRSDIYQISVCLTDLVTGQDGLQLISRLSTMTFSVLVDRLLIGRILSWLPGGKRNGDFTLLYR